MRGLTNTVISLPRLFLASPSSPPHLSSARARQASDSLEAASQLKLAQLEAHQKVELAELKARSDLAERANQMEVAKLKAAEARTEENEAADKKSVGKFEAAEQKFDARTNNNIGRVVAEDARFQSSDARFRSVTEHSINNLHNAEMTLKAAVSGNLTEAVNASVTNAISVIAGNIKEEVKKDVTKTVQEAVDRKMAVVTSNITKLDATVMDIKARLTNLSSVLNTGHAQEMLTSSNLSTIETWVKNNHRMIKELASYSGDSSLAMEKKLHHLECLLKNASKPVTSTSDCTNCTAQFKEIRLELHPVYM